MARAFDETETRVDPPPAAPGSGLPETIGPYRVVRELGRGGMGLVLEVSHPAFARPKAAGGAGE